MANLGDIQQMVKTYVIQTLKEQYPNLDLTPGSPEMDTTVGPLIALLSPFIRKINRWDINQNLDNKDIILESDLDAIGQSNFFKPRKLGSFATGSVVIGFKSVPDQGSLVIPSGFMVQNGSTGKNYVVITPIEFTQDALVQYYNINTFLYDIPVAVKCEEVGVVGNSEVGAINKIIKPINGAVSVTNDIAVSNGIDKESNALYVNRIKTDYLSKISGMTYGYTSEVVDNFPKVTGLYVAGKDDPLMMRDILDVVGVGPVHIGGAVDLYVQGADPLLVSFQTQVTGNNFLIEKKLLTGVTSILNRSTGIPITNVSYSLEYRDPTKAGSNTEVAYIRILDLASEGDLITTVFTYADASGIDLPDLTWTQTNTFSVNKFDIAGDPCTGIVSVTDDSRSTGLGISDYTFVVGNPSFLGTTRQDSSIVISDGYVSGDFVTITYSQDGIVTEIQDYYTAKRFACSDVLVRKAVKKLLYIWMDIKPKANMTLGDVEQEYIGVVVNAYADSIPMGGSIEESVLVDALHTNPQTAKFIEYISLPFVSLYVVDDGSQPIVRGVHQTAISLGLNEYAAAQWCQVDPITS